MTTLQQIKAWWSGSRVPTVIQRQETFDSFRHKDDKVAIGDVTDLSSAMNAKADLGEDGKLLPEQLPNTSNLGNWYVDEAGNLQNVIDEAGIASANWSIDANGYFSGTAGAANLLKRSPLEFVNKWYLDENDNLVFTEWDGEAYIDRGALEWSKLNAIAYNDDNARFGNLSIQNPNNPYNSVFFYSRPEGFQPSLQLSPGFDYADMFNFSISNINEAILSSGIIGDIPLLINSQHWNIDANGSFSGTCSGAENANFLGSFWDGSTEYGNLKTIEIDGQLQAAAINTLNWNINHDGIAELNYIRLYDGANLVWTDIMTQDSGYVFFDYQGWAVMSIQDDNISMGDGGNGGAWAIYKPYGLTTGSSVGCWMPNINAKTLAVSVNENFADSTGNIKKLLKSLTTSEINALSGADAETSLMYYNTTLDCPVYKSASGWRKFSHTAM